MFNSTRVSLTSSQSSRRDNSKFQSRTYVYENAVFFYANNNVLYERRGYIIDTAADVR